MLSGRHLLVDGKNILYRAVFVRSNDSPIDVFFRILISNMHKAEADYCHIFWDCPRSETWRRKLLDTYKAKRDQNKDPEIGEMIGKCFKALYDVIPKLGMYNYYVPSLEADDLIYSFVAAYHPVETVILSSDSDLLQLPFRYYSTRVLHPQNGFLDRPLINPVYQKCLVGDTSDNLEGYKNIGPVKSEKLLRSVNSFYDFVSKDPKIFLLNLNLVDLSMCPYQMRAQYSIVRCLNSGLNFDLNDARSIFANYKMYPQLSNLDWTKFHHKREESK